MEKENIQAVEQWYRERRPVYEQFADAVRTSLLSVIAQEKIPVVAVTHRAKEVSSFLDKVSIKDYSDPKTETTDLAGVRIITFIESDVDRVCELVNGMFNVHTDKSLDKSQQLRKDRFGYRSVHYVCDLGANRHKLPENAPYRGLLVEIQIRTVLQHAWAEIQHDRGYKFAGQLPPAIERRLYGQAAVLELVDREFDRIASEIDDYAQKVKQQTEEGNLDAELNTASLLEYLQTVEVKLKKGNHAFERFALA